MTAPVGEGQASLATRLRRARFDARMVLGRTPGGHHLVSWWNWARVRDPHALVTRRTGLVIDGFPSSGNSFAIAALRAAAESSGVELPAVAHHLHNPGQVRVAATRGVPVLLLIREPQANAVSALTRWPSLGAEQVLRGYVGYYERLRPMWPGVVVAEFEQVVTNFGDVTRRLNRRYDRELPEFEHTPGNAGLLYRDDEGRSARRLAAEAVRAQLSDSRLRGLLEQAQAVHRSLSALAVDPSP